MPRADCHRTRHIEFGTDTHLTDRLGICVAERSRRAVRGVCRVVRRLGRVVAALGVLRPLVRARRPAERTGLERGTASSSGPAHVSVPTPTTLVPSGDRVRHHRAAQAVRTTAASSGVWVHPLLGWRLDLAGREIVYETDLAQVDYLADHRVGGTIVMPTTGYLELALAAGRDASFKYLEVRDLKIRRPLILEERAGGRVQVVLAPDGAGFACRMLRWAGDHWQAHATCRLEAEGEEQRASDPVVLPRDTAGPEVPRSVAAHYAGCRAVGLALRPGLSRGPCTVVAGRRRGAG